MVWGIDQLGEFLASYNNVRRFVVAYSGGMDSHVLLHALVEWAKDRPEISIQAVYINHQMSENAQLWQQHTQNVCAQLGVSYAARVITANIVAGDSVEAVLRDARYAALADWVGDESTALFCGHHADDQVETLLLHLLRGSGPAGLGAMGCAQPFAAGLLLRPLLGVARVEIMDYAQRHQLSWIEDESNRDSRFDRNYLRNEVIPQMRERWPSLAATIGRSAWQCQKAQSLLADLAKQDLGSLSVPLNWRLLSGLAQDRQENALRYWLREQGVQSPTSAQMDNWLRQLRDSAVDRTPTLEFAGGILRAYRGYIYFDLRQERGLLSKTVWDLASPLDLPGGWGRLVPELVVGSGIDLGRLSMPVCVQTRQGGERLLLSGVPYHQTLKNCWQRWGVPPWERDVMPLLYVDSQLLAVPGYGCAAEWAPAAGKPGVIIRWERAKL